MTVTLQQIARKANVGVSTVSEILSRKSNLYNPKTREKVLRIAQELGYRPNTYAMSIAKRKFGAIALLLSTERHRSYLPSQLLDGINDTLDKHNYHLTVMKLPDEKLCKEGYLPKALRERLSDGLLVNYNARIPKTLIKTIEESNLPAIWINVKRKTDAVYPDDYEGGKSATKYLIELGYKKIAYVSYSHNIKDLTHPGHYSIYDRYLGYLDAMKQANLTPLKPILPEKDLPHKNRADFTYNWLKQKNRPDAIITYARSTALPILWTASNTRIKIPNDLAVVTFSNDGPIDELSITVTSFCISEYTLGEISAQMILDKIKTPKKSQSSMPLKYELFIGDTT